MKTILATLCFALTGCAGFPPITASFAGNYGTYTYSAKKGIVVDLKNLVTPEK